MVNPGGDSCEKLDTDSLTLLPPALRRLCLCGISWNSSFLTTSSVSSSFFLDFGAPKALNQALKFGVADFGFCGSSGDFVSESVFAEA